MPKENSLALVAPKYMYLQKWINLSATRKARAVETRLDPLRFLSASYSGPPTTCPYSEHLRS